MFGRRKNNDVNGYSNGFQPSKSEIKRSTRPRLGWSLLTSFFLLVTVVFLILVEVGNTSNSTIPNKIHFIRLNLLSIVSLLGLYDYYTVGLWNYCEGYLATGIAQCSKTKAMYWFDPERILSNQLPAGTSIDFPQDVTDALPTIHIASNWMFGLFLAGACLSFVLIFVVPLVSVQSKLATLLVMIFTFLAAAMTTAAAIIATAVFSIVKDKVSTVMVLGEQAITAELGSQMFAFMWVAAIASIIAWLVQLGMTCCCTSRRDIRTGRKSKNIKRDSEQGLFEEKKHDEST